MNFSIADLIKYSPIVEQLCSHLTFEQANDLREALHLPILKVRVPISDCNRKMNSFPYLTSTICKLAKRIQEFGSTTAFLKSVEEDDYESTKILLEQGVNVNVVDSQKYNACMFAIANNNCKMVELLLQYRIDCNATDWQGGTALIWAADSGCLPIVQLLIQKKVRLNISDDSGYTALMYASGKGYKEIVSVLLKAGARTDAMENSKGYTAFDLANTRGHFEVIRLLYCY